MTIEQKETIIQNFGSINNYELIQARQYLENTDYIANKIIEYKFLGKELEKDYTDILEKREEARNKIRELEE